MRLLILNWRDLEHPRAGGSEVFAQNLARQWAEAGHDVTLFCSEVAGAPFEDKRDGYKIIRRGSRFTVYRRARQFFLEGTAGEFDAILDIVNTRPFFSPDWAGNTRTVALIYQVAREVWRYEVPLPAALVGRHVLEPRWLGRYSTTPTLTISASSEVSLRAYGLKNVSVVSIGVDPPLDRPLPAKSVKPSIIFVGRLSANKRPGDAIEAYEIVRRQIPDAELWIVGDGPLAKSLKRKAGPGVRFFGKVDNATKQDLMASATVLVGTAVREGWGLTVSEAALLGTRSVGYDVPGLRDSIPAAHGILTVPNPSGLASALIRVLRESGQERADLGSAGVVSWPEVASEVLTYLT